MTKLNAKIAIITGAAGGIGRATAQTFVREGARVMLVDRDERALQALATELGSNTAYTAADVASCEDTERYVRATVERFHGIDILFANAGIEGTVSPIATLPVDAFDRVLDVNVRGVFLALKYAIPELVRRGGGSILITSSVAGMIGSPGLSAYVTSKHAIVGLAKCAALELAPHQIRVNTIHPGPIDNRMMRGLEEQLSPGHSDDAKRGFEAQVPLGRYGTNQEIANLALFLASSEATFCTGAMFVADGGYTTH
ncbi:MAG TPA: SDR family NAD(P)-dependent oxidoreductase [Polyangiales bacterium]|nr:SDR family NAD(P)-dependent oxidoreductase [Polyangiales bacterium]